MAESDGSEVNYETRKSTNKSRRSLFLPPDVTVSEPTKTKTSDVEYVNILKSEEDMWKQIYMEQKVQKKKLLKKLETNESQNIDYSIFDEEEIKYLNSGPNMALFVQEAEDLEKLVKIFNSQFEQKKQIYDLLLENIENACLTVTKKLNN